MKDKHDNIISDEQIAAFLDGNIESGEFPALLDAIKNNPEVAEIIALSPQIDYEVNKETNRHLPMRELAASSRENLCSFECETFILSHLDFDIDHWTLLEEAKANNWVRKHGTPLHLVGKLLELKGLFVERKYDATIKDLQKAVDSGKQVIAIVDKKVIENSSESASPAYHAIYVTGVEDGAVEYLDLETLLETDIDKDVFKKAWKISGNYMVTASETDNDYTPRPIDVSDIPLDADLEELTEAIAENAHDTWARARMDEGWTYGPVRDDRKKTHPDLIPYSRLPESEKEYDRLMAMNTLRLVLRLGFDIVNRK